MMSYTAIGGYFYKVRPKTSYKESYTYIPYLGGGFKYFLFSPLPGEMIQFDEHIFQMGWFNH